MSDHRGEENIIAVHLADAVSPAPHMLHVCRGHVTTRDGAIVRAISYIVRSRNAVSDKLLCYLLHTDEIVEYLTSDVGYVIDVTYKDLPTEPGAWFVKFTAYRTVGYQRMYVTDTTRCRGGVLVRVKGPELTFYGETGIFCGLSDLFFGAGKYRVYSPPAPQLPEAVWVYFHKGSGRLAFALDHDWECAPGYTKVKYTDVSKVTNKR